MDGWKMMKYATAGLLVLCFVFPIFFNSDPRDEYDMEREAKQDQIADRYKEGISYAQKAIVNHLDTERMDLDFEIEESYGLHPEKALRIMENYLDNEPVSEDELANAIWAIRSYYYKSEDILDGVEDYWID